MIKLANQNDSNVKGEIVNLSDPESRKFWLEKRRLGIGGSDVSAVLGINPWKTPFNIWQDKTGKIELDSGQNQAMYWGNRLEDIVADEFQLRTGKKVQRRNQMFKMESAPFMIANIDRYICNERSVLECKTSNAFMAKTWGDPDSDLVPMQYLAQCVHYMIVTGYHEAFLAVLIGGNDYRIYRIPFEQKLADLILAKCDTFWNDHVQKDIPPDPINLDDIKEMYAISKAEVIGATNDIVKDLETYNKLKEEMKILKTDQDALKFKVQSFMKDHDTIADATGNVLATWKTNEVTKLDSKALKEENEKLWNSFAKTSKQRTLRVK